MRYHSWIFGKSLLRGIERLVHHDLKSLGRDEIQRILDVKTLQATS